MLNYLVTRQHEATDRLLDELIAAKPSNWHLYPMKAFNYVGWGKPTSSLHAVLGAAPAPALAPESFGGDGTTCQVLFAWILVDAAEGAWTRMINRLAAAPDCRGGSMGNMGFSLDLYAALALRKLGRDADAAGAVEAAVQRYQSAAERRPQRYSPNASLGLAYAVQGDREAALHYAERAVSLLPIEQDAFQGIEPYYFYVRTLAQVGEIDRALEGVEQLLSIPSWLTIENIRADPFLEPIVADGRFEELADKYGRRDRSE
jgi:tetratricopeptide (TPR) repeat protein